jgi:hypothetical protein
MNLQSARVRRTKKVLKARYSAFTIRNLHQYDTPGVCIIKGFYDFFPNNRFVNPSLFIKQARTCTCTRTSYMYLYLPLCYRGFQAYKRSLETLGTRGNTKETCTCILVPRTSYMYLYLYLVPVPRTYLVPVPVPRTRTYTYTSYLYLYLYLVPVHVPRTCTDILGYSISNL